MEAVLRQEVPVEVPQIQALELLTEVPKPQYHHVQKEIPMCLDFILECPRHCEVSLRSPRADREHPGGLATWKGLCNV